MLPAIGSRGVRGGRRGGRGGRVGSGGNASGRGRRIARPEPVAERVEEPVAGPSTIGRRRKIARSEPVAERVEEPVAVPSTIGRRRGIARPEPVAERVEEPVAGSSTIGCGRGGGRRRSERGGAGELALPRKPKTVLASGRTEYQTRQRAKQLEAMMPDAPPHKCVRRQELLQEMKQVEQKRQELNQLEQEVNQLEQELVQQAQEQHSRSTDSSLQPLLLCGGLRADGEGLILPVRTRSPASSMLSIPKPEHRGEAMITASTLRRPSTIAAVVNEGLEAVGGAESHGAEIGNASMPHSPHAGSNNMTSDKYSTSDDDNDDIEDPASPECAIDFTIDAPAFLPNTLYKYVRDFIQEMDSESDQLLTGLLNSDSADHLTFDWIDDPTFTGYAECFESDFGPTFPVIETTRPCDIFKKYFDEEVMALIVEMTNAKLERLQSHPLQGHSRLHKAKKTTMDEMYVFIAVLILQGLCPLGVEKEYFCENGPLTFKSFKTLISYGRFMLLHRIFADHDNGNSGTATSPDVVTLDNEKLRELGPLLNLLRSRFRGLYLPGRDIAIDESLLKWHGRLSFEQKFATKAAKVRVKTFELCESKTGYCWDFIMYTSKGHTYGQTDRPELEDETDKDTQGGDIVPRCVTAKNLLELLQPLLNKGHTLVMDYFYNSPLLARYLKINHTDCFGTLRVDRKFAPKAFKNRIIRMRQGEVVSSHCGDLSVSVWRHDNDVAMISTRHAGEIGGTEKRGPKYKPQVVLDYNQAMGGVNKKEQYLSSHPIERKQAWYKKVFWRLLNYAVLNAYICYKTANPSSLHYRFRKDLAKELIAMTSTRPIARPLSGTSRTLTVREIARVSHGKIERPVLDGNHFIGPGPRKAARCVSCKVSRSKYICKQCHVTLCLMPCFERYHS